MFIKKILKEMLVVAIAVTLTLIGFAMFLTPVKATTFDLAIKGNEQINYHFLDR